MQPGEQDAPWLDPARLGQPDRQQSLQRLEAGRLFKESTIV